MKKLLLILLLLNTSSAMAGILTEDFEADFPEWETNWLGINSNLQNHYGVGADRGNNPDGLWINDGLANGAAAEITFNSAFGSSITDFSIDTTTWVADALFQAFDMSGNVLIATAITEMQGGYTDPGTYQTISFSTTNGLSGFSITGGRIEGNTSIDNVVVTTNSVTVDVPEPTSMLLLGLGLAGIGASRRKKTV